MQNLTLAKATRIVLLLFFFFISLHFAKPFLVPVAFGLLLAMLFLPLCRWMEKKGIGKGFSAVLCIVILVLVFCGIFGLLAWQVSDLAKDAGKMEQQVTAAITKFKTNISTNLGISPKEQEEIFKKGQSSGGSMGTIVTGFLGAISGIMVDTVLVLVYLFLMLYFRTHLKKFVLRLVAKEEQPETEEIMNSSTKVAFKYLSGMGLMIVMLWVMYGIGFSIAGVKNALFFAVLCGVLEIIPFVGNLTGTGLTVLMGITQGGGSGIIIGILVTYALVQFIQTYLLEPLVVGNAVNLNPLFTIMGIVLGEFVWGVSGMILAIPYIGIAKIVFDHIEPLKPYGYLLGEEESSKEGFIDKLKKKFTKK